MKRRISRCSTQLAYRMYAKHILYTHQEFFEIGSTCLVGNADLRSLILKYPYLPTNILRLALKSPAASVQK